MEQRHEPAAASDPGLLVPIYGTVAGYPAAAIVTAWAKHIAVDPPPRFVPPMIDPHEPLLPAAASVPFWPEARLPLVAALQAVPSSWYPARCALPVPGDLGGLPAGAPRALAAGQAVILAEGDDAVVISPMTVGGARMWTAERTANTPVAPAHLADVKREIMGAMEQAILVAESAVLPRREMSADLAAITETPVPLPPGTAAPVVALARQSATVLAIVAAVMRHLDASAEAEAVAQALVPLGRAGRRGLSVAFTAAAGH